jgi:hypothetical protein
MDIVLWIGLFAVTSLFWAWVVFLGGAEWLEGPLAAIIAHVRAAEVSAEGLKVIAMVCWLFEAVMFVIGLIDSDARRFWL